MGKRGAENWERGESRLGLCHLSSAIRHLSPLSQRLGVSAGDLLLCSLQKRLEV